MRIKQFILIAAVAIVASSCAHSFEAQETQQPAIGFGTWAEQLTKARTAGSNTFVADDDFAVYGYYSKTVNEQEVKTTVFDNVTVTASGSPVTWAYSPLRFWDPTADKYTFFAVSPASYANNVNAQTGLFTSESIDFTTHDKDVLVATKKVVVAAGQAPKYSADPVVLAFNHIAAMIDVKVKKDAALPAEATLRITNARLLNIQNTGTFEVTSYDGSSKPVVSWASTASGYYDWSEASLDVTQTTDYTHDPSVTEGDEKYLFNNFVLMPQTLDPDGENDPKLHIEYKVVTQEATNEQSEVSTSYTADIAIKSFIVNDNKTNEGDAVGSSWAQGTHYTYILTIGANAITFTANINPWETVTGYRYLLQ